jgi:hypothetical protein
MAEGAETAGGGAAERDGVGSTVVGARPFVQHRGGA